MVTCGLLPSDCRAGGSRSGKQAREALALGMPLHTSEAGAPCRLSPQQPALPVTASCRQDREPPDTHCHFPVSASPRYQNLLLQDRVYLKTCLRKYCGSWTLLSSSYSWQFGSGCRAKGTYHHVLTSPRVLSGCPCKNRLPCGNVNLPSPHTPTCYSAAAPGARGRFYTR